jgi:hypothetical protein
MTLHDLECITAKENELPWRSPTELDWAKKAWMAILTHVETKELARDQELRAGLFLAIACLFDDSKVVAWEEFAERQMGSWAADFEIDDVRLGVIVGARKLVDESDSDNPYGDSLRSQCLERLADSLRPDVFDAIAWGFQGQDKLFGSFIRLYESRNSSSQFCERPKSSEQINTEEQNAIEWWEDTAKVVRSFGGGIREMNDLDPIYHIAHWITLGCPSLAF